MLGGWRLQASDLGYSHSLLRYKYRISFKIIILSLLRMKDIIAMRIKNGDEQAFELLFRKYYLKLRSFVNKFLHDQEEAEEIVEEVFVRIWENRQSIDPDNSLVSYMFKTAQNLSLNAIRKKKTISRSIEVLQAEYADNIYSYSSEDHHVFELEANIASAIEKIPARSKEVFMLSRMSGLKYDQIAHKLNISIRTVEVHISKALKILRVQLRDFL